MAKTEVGYPEGGKKYKVPADSVGQDPRANIVTNDFTPGQKIDKVQKLVFKVKAQYWLLKKEKQLGINMWFSAIRLAVSAGSKIYANRQKAKMAMSDAQLLHAERQARGEEAYQGKLLEARQNDYKDEVVLLILTLPILVLAYGVWSDDPAAMDKIKVFFEHFQALPSWFTNLWILVCASIFGIKGTQIFRNGGKK